MSQVVLLRVLLAALLTLTCAWLPHDGEGGPKDIGNSAPAGIGGNGPWTSRNMQLLGRLTLSQLGSGGAANVLGNDCWGWTDPQTGKEYAICGLTNATSFVDISDPTDPKYLGKLNTQTGNATWRDMKVYSDHVFVVADLNGAHGMQVFDLTELRTADPANPQIFSNSAWFGGFEEAHNIAINEDSGFAYIVGSEQASGGLYVIDISNPTSPVFAGEYTGDGYTHDVQVVNYNGPDSDYAGREIAFCSNEDTVTIVDVTNKNSMSMISRNGYAQDAYTHQGWLSEDHRWFYMGDELDESNFGGPTRMHVFDCQDLDNPVYRGFFEGNTNAIDHNLYIKDGLIYSGSYAAGIRILEPQADPGQLEEIAFFDTYNTNTGVNFDGVWSVFPYYDSGTILVNDRQNGMFLVKLTPIVLAFPDGIPETVNSAGGVEFTVRAEDFAGTPQPGTAVLHIDRGNGYETFPLPETSPNLYDVVFPASQCGSVVSFFISAEDTNGEQVCSPNNAPNETYTAHSAYGFTVTLEDDFESDSGWTVTGDASDGQWERGVPAGGGSRGDPESDADGSGQCYLTDNVAGNSDVDDGSTVLVSPVFDATHPQAMDSLISYFRWFSNDFGAEPNADVFEVEISNDGGSNWTHVETVGPDGSEVSGLWFKHAFRISEFITATSQMRLRFTASDLDGGSVVEAALDGLQVQVLDCLEKAVLEGVKLLDGEVISGGFSAITMADNSHVQILPPATTNLNKQIVELEVVGAVGNIGTDVLRIKMEAHFNGGPEGDVVQQIRLRNHTALAYDSIDIRIASSGTDFLIDIPVAGNVSDYINPFTGEVNALIKWTSPGFAGSPYLWDVEIDQVEILARPAAPEKRSDPRPSRPKGKSEFKDKRRGSR